MLARRTASSFDKRGQAWVGDSEAHRVRLLR